MTIRVKMGRPSAMIEERLLALLEKESIGQDAAWIANKLSVSKKTVGERLRRLTRTGAVTSFAGIRSGPSRCIYYQFVPEGKRVPVPDQEKMRPAIIRVLSGRLDEDGFGEWMSVLAIAGKNMPHIPVQRRLAELWREGLVDVRLASDGPAPYETNEYRIQPLGDQAPLYGPKDGWNTKALAECLDGMTYPQKTQESSA